MDLDALRALDAVVTEGGFAKAASRLGRVQSAVSYQVSKLENQAGIKLLDRQGYRVALTPAGELILAEGRSLLAQAGRLNAMARQLASGWEPRLTVVVDGVLPLEPVLRAVQSLNEAQAPTRIEVRVEFLRGVQHRFESDGADLMLVKDFEPHPDLTERPMDEIECVLCAAPTHALAMLCGIERDVLRSHVELAIQDSQNQGDDRHMFGGERVVFFPGFAAKKQALLMGLGFGWMPFYMIEPELRAGALAEISLNEGSRYRFTPYLVERRDRPLGPAGSKLAEMIFRSEMHIDISDNIS